jgi:hypothetical protein
MCNAPRSTMRGTFRTDLGLRADPLHPGAFELRRRWGPRAASLAMIGFGVAFAVADLWLQRPVVAAFTGLAALALLALHVRAEVESWRFDGAQVVRRDLELLRLRVREERLPASQIEEVAYEERGPRARAWLVTQSGLHPLVEGKPAAVRRIAEDFRNAVALAKAERPGDGAQLH